MSVVHLVRRDELGGGRGGGREGGREGRRGLPEDAVGVGVLHVLVGDDDIVFVRHVVCQGVLHHQPEKAREGGRKGGREGQ